MRILFLSHKFYPELGGIETSSEMIASGFSEAGHEVCLITWTADTKNIKFPFKILRKPSLIDFFEVYRWAEVVFENNLSLRLSWPNIFFRRPYVVALHTWLMQEDGKITWRERLKFNHLKYAASVIACSNALRARCWPNAIVIGNSYKKEIFRILPQITKQQDFVFLGRLVSDKGVDTAIKAFSRLKANEYNSNRYKFTIIGDGPEMQLLKSLVYDLKLENNINFTGSLSGEGLVILLNQHKYMIVPSTWEEPFGIVALEGIACGCIPIVSDGGGLPDAVGNAGLIFKRGDINDMLKKIECLINDEELQNILRSNAENHLKTFEPPCILEKYLKQLEIAFKNGN